jgi:hypothetical protein
MARKKVMKQTNGLYPAPLRILEVVRAGLDKGPEGGYEAERTKFGELVVTSEAKGLISLFHGQTECKKNHFGAPAKRSQTIGRKSIFFFGLSSQKCGISLNHIQCCGSESGSESERIRAFLAGTESEIFVPDSDSDPNSDPDPVPDPVL